ncbi:hypothetical protein LZ31DRAFT_283074 [Colletotrichum somersetense]|nr:hypothetical protein LZ31DRAFT_283074 [Colletotrichum somersetense]
MHTSHPHPPNQLKANPHTTLDGTPRQSSVAFAKSRLNATALENRANITHTLPPSTGLRVVHWGRLCNQPLCQLGSRLPAFVPVRVSKSCAPGRDAENMQQAHPYHPLGFVADCKTLCTISSPYYLVKHQSPSLILNLPLGIERWAIQQTNHQLSFNP